MALIPVLSIWVRFARLSSSLRLPLSVKAGRRLLSSSPARSPDLVDRYQHRSAFLLNHKHYEFRRFGLARVSADDVNIRGTFIEGLTGRQRHFLSAPHLHHD